MTCPAHTPFFWVMQMAAKTRKFPLHSQPLTSADPTIAYCAQGVLPVASLSKYCFDVRKTSAIDASMLTRDGWVSCMTSFQPETGLPGKSTMYG